jgi:hypothetical protein
MVQARPGPDKFQCNLGVKGLDSFSELKKDANFDNIRSRIS